VLQNIDYSYDRVGNIKKTENQPFITRDATSRSVVQEYGYDDLHRLTSAAGNYAIGSDHIDRYAGTFAYDSIGNFQTKDQRHWYEDPLTGSQSDRPRTTYNFAYQYQGPQPHAVTNVGGNTYSYDDNGNLALRVDDQTGQSRQILWNEENRITSLLDQGKETIFRYDDGGTRIFKRGKYGETIYVDPNFSIREGEVASKHIFAGSTRIATKMVMKENRTGASKTTYVRPTDNKGHSATVPEKSQGNHGQVDKTFDPVLQEQVNGKAWEERDRKTASANGKGLGKEKRNANGGDAARDTLLPGNSEKGLENALSNGNGSKTGIYKRLDRLGYEVTIDHRIVLKGTDPTDPDGGAPIFTGPTIPEELQIYYFHGDHLGSSSVITDRFGRNYEHLEYFPYGETWVEETRSERNLPYKFTGKELDPETGLYYFGARYYDPVVSVWVSVDPIIDKYLPNGDRNRNKNLAGLGGVYNPLNLSVYGYGHLNPLKFTDPDGNVVLVDDAVVGSAIILVGGITHVMSNPKTRAAMARAAEQGVANFKANVHTAVDKIKNLIFNEGQEEADKTDEVKPVSPEIKSEGLEGKSRGDIKNLADDLGLKPAGNKDDKDYPRKWKDPATGKERIRLDRGHTDPKTGQPYDDPNAAVDHGHGYTPEGKPMTDSTGNKHFPTTGE
jgi:RHS repeat-associated protein